MKCTLCYQLSVHSAQCTSSILVVKNKFTYCNYRGQSWDLVHFRRGCEFSKSILNVRLLHQEARSAMSMSWRLSLSMVKLLDDYNLVWHIS